MASVRRIGAATCLASVAAVGAALAAQHLWGYQPCPWCILQRLLFCLTAAGGLVAWVAPQRMVGLGGTGLTLLSAVAGAAAAVYQNQVAAKSQSCDLSLAEQVISWLKVDKALPEVFEVRASCADAAVNVLGVPFELWSATLFALLALAAAWTLLRRR